MPLPPHYIDFWGFPLRKQQLQDTMLSQLTSPEILIHGLYFLISLLCWRETWVIMMFVLIQEVFPVPLFARRHIRGRYLPLLFFFLQRSDQECNATLQSIRRPFPRSGRQAHYDHSALPGLLRKRFPMLGMGFPQLTSRTSLFFYSTRVRVLCATITGFRSVLSCLLRYYPALPFTSAFSLSLSDSTHI